MHLYTYVFNEVVKYFFENDYYKKCIAFSIQIEDRSILANYQQFVVLSGVEIVVENRKPNEVLDTLTVQVTEEHKQVLILATRQVFIQGVITREQNKYLLRVFHRFF